MDKEYMNMLLEVAKKKWSQVSDRRINKIKQLWINLLSCFYFTSLPSAGDSEASFSVSSSSPSESCKFSTSNSSCFSDIFTPIVLNLCPLGIIILL